MKIYKNRALSMLLCLVMFGLLMQFSLCCGAEELFKVTAYCSCEKCCGKYADGITASGKPAQKGYCACNWLPFGSEIEIEGLGTYKVMDRGAKSLFGDKNNHIRHIDIWFPEHKKAKQFGVKWLKVKIKSKEQNEF
jgi:3D (Asp-Asp-Asp) domain-containing protein